MSLQQNIGIALKALRAEKGISQEKLALETGIGRRYMSDIENGRRNISLEIIEKIAAFFEMSVSELVQKIEQVKIPPLTMKELKRYLCDCGYEDTIILESPDYLSAIVGISDDARIIYDYEKMVKFLMISEGMDYEEAIEFIDFNTLGALPYMGEKRPIILNRIEGGV
jgi:transcriptional regulator with XRE-family HTH domain